jgi:tRNA-dihydrouridine synthase B
MSVKIGSIELPMPVLLAPMSGVTDMPFRRLVKRQGAGLVISEMIASQAMIRHTRQTMKMVEKSPEEKTMAMRSSSRRARLRLTPRWNWRSMKALQIMLSVTSLILLINLNRAFISLTTPELIVSTGSLQRNHQEVEIPKLIHFVYVSPGLPKTQKYPPEKVVIVIQEWKDMNPAWQVILWNNTMVQETFPEIYNLAGNIKQMSWVSNLVRYNAVYKFGGIYVDTDIVSVHPLDGLLQYVHYPFSVCENPLSRLKGQKDGNVKPTAANTEFVMEPGTCKVACNAVMGFPARHPAMHEVVDVTMRQSREVVDAFEFFGRNPRHNLEHSGPPQWTSIIKKYPDVAILKAFSFFPCHWRNTKDCDLDKYKDDPRVFAMHMWSKSWNLDDYPMADYLIERWIFASRALRSKFGF